VTEKTKSRPGARVSVVIPALNEERHIGDCLASLARLHSAAAGAIEVIVVDNGSTDKTVDIAESFRHSLDVRVIRRPGVSVSAARNCGASHANGELLAFLDADCVVPEGWLESAGAQLALPGCGLVGAFYTLPAGSSWVATTWAGHLSRVPNGEVSYVGAHNMVLCRSVFHRVGGFDESLQTNEDYEFCQRIAAAGLKVFACDAASVIHLGTPQSLGDFFRRERWHGRHVVKVFLRNISKLHNCRAVLFAVFTLAAVAAMFVGIVAAMAGGSAVLAWASLLAWFVVSLALSVWSMRRTRTWGRVPPLMILFLTWGLARAVALVDTALPSALLKRKWESRHS